MKDTTKNLEIERLRAVAVIMVTVAHGIMTSILPTFMFFSFYGVDLFFVISGFVVTLSFLKLIPNWKSKSTPKERIQKSIPTLKVFYLKRIFRIWPLATFWMFAFLFLSIYYGSNFNTALNTMWDILGVMSGFYNYLVSYGYPGNISHYWSLATEMQFYLILPVLLVVVVKKEARVKSILLIIGILFSLFIIYSVRPISILKYIYAQRYFTLFFGVLIALFYKDSSRLTLTLNTFVTRHNTFLRVIVAPFLLISLWLIPGFTKPEFFNGFGFIIAGFIAAFLVILASYNQGLILNIPILRTILEYIGSRSYSIYLCHLHFVRLRPTLISTFDAHLAEWFKTGRLGLTLQYILIWIGMLIVSEIAFRFIEKPFISLGHAYIKQNFKSRF